MIDKLLSETNVSVVSAILMQLPIIGALMDYNFDLPLSPSFEHNLSSYLDELYLTVLTDFSPNSQLTREYINKHYYLFNTYDFLFANNLKNPVLNSAKMYIKSAAVRSYVKKSA
jgi:hypothetical protein